MLIHEDHELESAAMSGDFDVIVPVSVFVPEIGEHEIVAYNCVWDICEKYERDNRSDILNRGAIEKLFSEVAPAASQMGYSIDSKGSRVILEHRIKEPTAAIIEEAAGALIIRSAVEINGLVCPLLHHPEPDEYDETDVCAVVVKDGVICACAGVNDLADDDACEIFVETAAEYCGKGYGTAAVAALVLHLCGQGCEVAYNCAENNLASSAIARKLGMTLIGRRLSMICYAGEIFDT